jgi:hypothetical protein
MLLKSYERKLKGLRVTKTFEGTNIPVDPRHRKRNHARVEIQVWVEVPDSVFSTPLLEQGTDLLAALRTIFGDEYKDGLRGAINDNAHASGLPDICPRVDLRVSR